MKNKKVVLGLVIFLALMILCYIFMKTLESNVSIDNEYTKLGLDVEDYEIEYYTVYYKDILGEYKVYKIKNYYTDSMKKFEEQLENSELWSRDKFYEYIMLKFYEIQENENVYIDRDNVYYYHKNGVYAIFDLKNAKLYYFEKGLFEQEHKYANIFGIQINNYTGKEIYSVRSGPQNDGTDYYVYKFTEEKGKEIENELNLNNQWTRERLNDEILKSFEYNEEVKEIENGYYHYKKVCRTSDNWKKYFFTDEEATGYEVGIYDVDKNILYYYWTSI